MIFVLTLKGFSQEARSLTLQQAEQEFLQRNFRLLAERYRVNAAEALVDQAKKWDNPTLSGTLGFGSLDKVQPFHIGGGGQLEGSVEQIVQMAGKRNKQVQLARWNAATSAAAFSELMRTLRLELRSSFYQLYFLKASEKTLRNQLGNLQRILEAYRSADASGSVAHADVIRLQALQVGIANDYTDLRQQEMDASLRLQLLLGSKEPVAPDAGPDVLQRYVLGRYDLAALTDTALANRPDLQVAARRLEAAKMNNRLQKALAVPDLHLGAAYDRQGSYTNNFIGLTVGVDLPLWNRNRGNIRASAQEVKAQAAELDEQQLTVSAEVANALEKIRFLEKGTEWPDLKSFNAEYTRLIDEVAANFRKGNISLLQFIDYFNSYSEHILHANKFLSDRVLAYEELNYTTGTQLFNNPQ
ncbi:TolC family protein [Chitinophaga rhizosphaerae]|uniref:TolC family protein n=1 Tax=Chitinophaga rhizosphaerae TaxID=1864947 RepID=UPI0013E07296|nr:TolC family protein [Chitinophaga rhizosphaerae]